MLALQIGEYRVGQPGATPVASNFLNVTVLDVFITGVLIPLIVRPRSLGYCAEYSAYPAFIIVLVALNRSYIDKEFSQDRGAEAFTVSTPHISTIVDSSAPTEGTRSNVVFMPFMV